MPDDELSGEGEQRSASEGEGGVSGIATLFFLFSTKRGKESEWYERRGERAQSHTPSAVRE